MSDTFRENVERTLREWDEQIERQRRVGPEQVEHGKELLAQLEHAEQRLGKDLGNFKRALRER